MDRKIIEVVNHYKNFNKDDIVKNKVGIEIQDFTDPNLEVEEIEKILGFYKEEFKDLTCIKAMHGPFIDLNPTSVDNDIRMISRKKYITSLRVAKDLNMDFLIFHSQINPGRVGKGMKDFTFKSNYKFWREILDQVGGFDGTILIENIFETNPKVLRELIEAIDLENIRINLDIGHSNLSGLPTSQWIYELKDYISYMHVHWNNGKDDEHRPPSREKVIDILNTVDKYGINPYISLEYTKNNLEEEIKKYKNS